VIDITEPATLLTDYVLAAFTAVLAVRLLARSAGAPRVRCWAGAFFATAVGGFTGGTFHGFRTSLGEPAASATWFVTMYAIGAASCAMLIAVVVATLRGAARRWLVFAACAKLAAYLVWVTAHPEFRYAIYDYGSSMAAMVVLEVAAPPHGLTRSGRWIVAGIGVSVVAAIVQQSGWQVHRHFNHNDLFHVIQAIAVWLLYRGALADVIPESALRSSAAAD
jgi:hypothetical protein